MNSAPDQKEAMKTKTVNLIAWCELEQCQKM